MSLPRNNVLRLEFLMTLLFGPRKKEPPEAIKPFPEGLDECPVCMGMYFFDERDDDGVPHHHHRDDKD